MLEAERHDERLANIQSQLVENMKEASLQGLIQIALLLIIAVGGAIALYHFW